MKCPLDDGENAGLLIEYCGGSLDADTAAALLRHVQSCGACSRALREQQAVWDALDDWEAPAVPAGFDRRLHAALGLAGHPGFLRRGLERLLWRPALPVAALAALLAAAVLLQRPGAVVEAPAPALAVEQVESALEDMEMLRQFNLVAATEAEPRRSM